MSSAFGIIGKRASALMGKIMVPGQSFTERVLHAGIWNFLLRSTTRAMGLVRNIILARILAPEDFGLFGITLVVLSILERFTHTGLQAALIQKDDDIRDYLDTAWSVQTLRSATLALTLVLGAPYIANFFEETRALPLFRVLGLSIFIGGLQNPGLLYFRRELEFQRQFQYQVIGTTADLVVSIALAFILRSAWALMFGLLAGKCALLVSSYFLHPYRPHLKIQWSYVRELGGYGRWVFLNNVLLFLVYRGDNFVVGKLLGAPSLGVYMLAFSIAEVVTVEISRIINNVAFPAYSRIQGKLERLREGFLLGIDLVASVALPVTVGMCFLAVPITAVLLGSRWSEVSTVLPLLAIAGSVRALMMNGKAALNAVGKPSQSFQINIAGVGVTYALMFPLVASRGLTGVALAVNGGLFGMLLPFLVYTKRTLGIGPREIFRRIIPALILSSLVASAIAGAQVIQGPPTVQLIVSAAGALIVYMAGSAVIWKISCTGPFGVGARFWQILRNQRSRTENNASTLAPLSQGASTMTPLMDADDDFPPIRDGG